FSTIKGVREDVLEILLNLKHIPVKSKTENADVNLEGFKIITLDSDDLPEDFFTREENPGVITAKDMPWDADFEFFGDGKLCTLEPKSHILMEIYVSQGVGYLSAERERPAAPALPVDAMLTDAIFSPVKRVNYTIKPARVGQSIDYERLVLEVWTNGALSPEDAVSEAARIAEDYFGIIANTVPTAPPVEVPPEPIETIQPELEEEESEEAPRLVEHFSHPIHELELSIRSENCLLRGGIKTIGDLLNSSRDDLLKIRNLGKISLKEIEDRLDMLGYELKLHSDKPESQPETSEDDDEIVEEPAVETESETEEPETEVQE
ncbi:MAG: hypothetical protein II832_01565, partial [Synergistaceae bacterium]|nr:hypothetical protein [Synergistaceae bacterium]